MTDPTIDSPNHPSRNLRAAAISRLDAPTAAVFCVGGCRVDDGEQQT